VREVRFVTAQFTPQQRHAADLSILAGTRHSLTATDFLIHPAEDAAQLDAYRRLRRAEFVVEQGLFAGTDRDDIDDDPRTVVLVATAPDGTVIGHFQATGVRPRFLGDLVNMGIKIPGSYFDPSQPL